MVTSSHELGHWIPLMWLSFGIDYVLWGMNPFGYHLMNGLAYLWAGRAPEAGIEFRNVVARAPDHPDGLAGLGMTLVALERPAESVEHLERAVALRPQAPLARYGLARAYLALGRRDAAEAQVAVLKTLEPALAEQALRR